MKKNNYKINKSYKKWQRPKASTIDTMFMFYKCGAKMKNKLPEWATTNYTI